MDCKARISRDLKDPLRVADAIVKAPSSAMRLPLQSNSASSKRPAPSASIRAETAFAANWFDLRSSLFKAGVALARIAPQSALSPL